MAAVDRNSDGSYDAVDSGGFGKDYHGQDAFGERIGGTGIGGNHFGGFEEGHFGVGDGREHFEREATSYGDITQTESMPKSAFEADNGNESEEEAGSGMRDSLKDLNSESSEENSKVGSLDTGFQIDNTEEDKEKHQQEYERAEEQLKEANEWGDGLKSVINESRTSLGASIDKLESKSISDKIAVHLTGLDGSVINQLGDLAEVLGYKDLDRNKIEAAYKENGTDGLRDVLKELCEGGEAYVDKTVKGVQDRRDHLKSIVDSYKSPTTDKTKSSFTDKMKPSTDNKTTTEAKPGKHMSNAKTPLSDYYTEANKDSTKELAPNRNDFGNHAVDNTEEEDVAERFKNAVKNFAKDPGSFVKDIAKNTESNVRSGGETVSEFFNDLVGGNIKLATNLFNKDKDKGKEGPSFPDTPTDNSDWKEAVRSFDVERAKEKEEEKAKTESKAKAEDKPKETNMSKATPVKSDYYTKANKDSTKVLPKETPSRNDFGNHAVDTFKGVVDRIADNTTAKSLGLQSIEEFARENGYDPNRLSTMKAYRSYQNKKIMKAIPGIVKQIGSYITERVKDAFDPSQMPERIRNTLARYNAATLIGAAILSIQSGAGIQASIDQALTMVDPEDQPAVSDYLEDVLNDEGTVNDLKVAFDDALAPEQNSGTAELDESIVNVGRKDNTDYSDFNAGLGTTSDADVKVFIARNVKADPILRRMISKMGK